RPASELALGMAEIRAKLARLWSLGRKPKGQRQYPDQFANVPRTELFRMLYRLARSQHPRHYARDRRDPTLRRRVDDRVRPRSRRRPLVRRHAVVMRHLSEKVCVVTGGGSGIGRALAHRFRAAGMRIAIGDIEAGTLSSVVDELGGDGDRVVGVPCDVRSIGDVRRLSDTTMKRFGGVHLVCLNAGVAPVGPLLEM